MALGKGALFLIAQVAAPGTFLSRAFVSPGGELHCYPLTHPGSVMVMRQGRKSLPPYGIHSVQKRGEKEERSRVWMVRGWWGGARGRGRGLRTTHRAPQRGPL